MLFKVFKGTGYYRLKMSDPVDLYKAEEFSRELNAFLDEIVNDQKVLPLLLDFSVLDYLDSSAIGVLTRLRKRCESDGIKMAFFGLQVQIKKVFEMTSLFKFFPFFETEQDAIIFLNAKE